MSWSRFASRTLGASFGKSAAAPAKQASSLSATVRMTMSPGD